MINLTFLPNAKSTFLKDIYMYTDFQILLASLKFCETFEQSTIRTELFHSPNIGWKVPLTCEELAKDLKPGEHD